MTSCAAQVRPTTTLPANPARASFWEDPVDLATRDLYYGPWGADHAPDPNAVYTFIRPKQGGTNPGVIVRDPGGREWHVKQPAMTGRGAEGPVEVVLSRVLSAVGYHQPPVYFLPSFTMTDGSVRRREVGGRFRLADERLEARGTWSWQQNPFVGTRPYQGLLAILMLFNSTDLKNANNTVYEFRPTDGRPERWYVVRDLGAALGVTGRIEPKRNDPVLFARSTFIKGISSGLVRFDYHGRHQELVRQRITPADVGWATDLLSRLTERQWADAFRAAGYPDDVAAHFIATIRARIAEGQQVALAGAEIAKGG
jgi:hypothetical protein